MTRTTLRTGIVVLLAAFLALGGRAWAQASDPADQVRRRLDATVAELDATLDAIAFLRATQADDRVYFMLPWWIDDDAHERAWGFTTRTEALRAITLHYLLRITQLGTPFDRHELAREISRSLREARTIVADYIDELELRAARLAAERNELEVDLAELATPSSGRCIDLVQVARENQLGGTMGSDADLSGPTSVIHTDASAADTQRGYPAQYTISWTSFPERICIGRPFTTTLGITNHLPTDGRSPGASVGITYNAAPHQVSVSCTNPDPYQVTLLSVDGGEHGGTSTCTITFDEFLGTVFTQHWLLRVRAGALGAGEGWLWFEYR